ncbi:uncharacterized protein LOC117927896 [Vitis riparia]|uniref:uncharacterized protein LOC117927896 n=1 Tax=Vitis riparia TaxID=96939 RepID=UPI00155AB5DF|nr:uncharacterized protein LOC117927896 [Vitis riparia]
MWLRVEGFKDLVRRWWTGYTFSGSFSHILACKLKALKQDLKTWNREVLGNVFSNKEAALSQIGYWDAKESDLGLSPEEAEARRRAVEDFSKWATMEEVSWRQKSQQPWLKGDENSRLFHKMANARRRRNYLIAIKVNGRRLTKEEVVKEEVLISFQRVLSRIDEWRPSISELAFSVLDREEASVLENPFSE